MKVKLQYIPHAWINSDWLDFLRCWQLLLSLHLKKLNIRMHSIRVTTNSLECFGKSLTSVSQGFAFRGPEVSHRGFIHQLDQYLCVIAFNRKVILLQYVNRVIYLEGKSYTFSYLHSKTVKMECECIRGYK